MSMSEISPVQDQSCTKPMDLMNNLSRLFHLGYVLGCVLSKAKLNKQSQFFSPLPTLFSLKRQRQNVPKTYSSRMVV